jgi:hypothetical protein
MCWGKLPRHPGRAHAWPLCGPWPRPHLAAAKLVELRSSVNLVAMPHQPLDRPLRRTPTQGCGDVRYAAHRSTPGCLGVAALRLAAERAGKTGSARKARSASGTNAAGVRTRRFALAPLARLAQPVARMLLVSVHDEWRTGSDGKARSGKWHEEASAWGSSPSRLCVLGRSLSHANDQESHPLPDPAAARRCGGRRPVIRC